MNSIKNGPQHRSGVARSGIQKYFRQLFFFVAIACLLLSSHISQAQTPSLEWAKGFGSSSVGWVYGITTDASGNVYTTGFFSGTTDFDPGPGVFNLSSSGGYDIYISKLDASGNFVWAVRMGGTTNDVGLGIALDLSGNVYTTGQFTGTADFNPGAPVFSMSSSGGDDIYISKLDNNGNFVWAKSVGGGSIDFANGIVADNAGNVYYGGYFNGTADFDPGAAVLNLISTGNTESFVSKLDTNGALVWAKSMGGPNIDLVYDVELDQVGNIYTTGSFRGTADFDPGAGTALLTSAGTDDIFVSKLDNNGNFLLAKSMGGPGDDYGNAIDIDFAGNILVTGLFSLTADFDPGIGVTNLTSAGQRDAFVSKLDASGNFVWARGMGGPGGDDSNDIATDDIGNSYITGTFSNTADFDPGAGIYNLTSVTFSPTDIYVLRLDASGNFGWAVAMGGTASDAGIGLGLDASNNVYVGGYFQGTADFDPSSGTFNLTAPAPYSSFVVKLSPPAAPTITDFSPKFGLVGTDVTITGTNFNSSTIVYFGGTATTTVFVSSTEIHAFVPFGSTFQPITATKAGQTAYSNKPFIVTFGDNDLMTACAFSTKRDNTTGAGPYSIGIGDLDRDGKPDIVSANFISNTLSIIRGLGSAMSGGSPYPAFSPKTDIATGSGPQGVALSDIDGDGKLDIVVANFTSNTVSVYRNTTTIVGTITFAARTDFTSGTGPYKIAINDFDGDGKSDIAIVNKTGALGLSVLRNISSPGTISTGSFQAKVDFGTGVNPEDLEITDIDGDNKPDIITVSPVDNSFSVLRNTAISGTIDATSFAPKVDFASGSASSNPFGIAIGDMDLDGDQDVLIANAGDNSIAVFRNSSSAGAISFAPHADFATGAGTYDVAVTDLDGDGRLDVAVSLQDPTIQGVLTVKNATVTSGSFVFNSFQLFGTDVAPWQIGIADFDADGRPDIATADLNSNAIAVFRNQVSSLPPTLFAVNYAPASGPELSTVTITGGPFSTYPSNNVVYFNGKQANVFSSTATSIVVTVPIGATTGLLTVTVGCQTAGNIVPFTVTPSSCVPVGQRNTLIQLYNDTNGAGWTNKTNWLSGNESTWYGVTVTGCIITKLLLNNNNLVGTLTADPGNLFDLKEIDLSQNKIDGDLPVNLVNAEGLTRISFADNKFSGVLPPEWKGFGEFGLLLSLDVSKNQLFGEIPLELKDVLSLKYLNLSHNELDGVIPDELGNLVNLEELYLDYNFLTGAVPTTFGSLTKIKKLSISNNELEVVPAPIGILPVIQYIDFSHNLLDVVPTFSSTSITHLALEYNNLKFGDLEPSIARAGFSYNPQSKLPPGGLISFVPGGTLSIPFATTGTANSYQWYKDGIAIPGATSTNLSRPGMTSSDVGFYTIRITSSIVTGLTLESLPYVVVTDGCSTSPRTSGMLDTSFDAKIGNPNYGGMELQSTGKIIISLNSNEINSVAVQGIYRFNQDGSVDNTFTTNSSYYASPSTLIIQPDDKILIGSSTGSFSQVTRLNADGTDDNAFNLNAPQYYAGGVSALALQPDNKILVSYSDFSGKQYLGRLNADGSADPSLSAPIDYNINTIKVKSDGKILVGGYFDSYLVQLTSSGAIDASFSTTLDMAVTDIAIQPDGKIIVVGYFNSVNGKSQQGIARLNADGTTDITFQLIGVTDDPSLSHAAFKIYLQSDGKILLGGEFDNISGTNRKNLVRLNNDGSVDCAFSPGAGTNGIIYDVVMQADGKILISGDFATFDGASRPAIARLINGPTVITILLQPSDAVVCTGAVAQFNTNATGTLNITYQWQFSLNSPINFTDIATGANYSGTTSKTLSVNTAASFGAGRYRCRINGTGAPEVITNDGGLFVNLVPVAPTTSNASSCVAASLALSASGGVNGQYRWYTVATGGTAIAGETNSVYNTPVLSVSTTYYVAINNSSCESTRTPVIAAVTIVAKPVITTTNCTASGATLTGPAGFITYTWSNGAGTQQISVTTAGSYTLTVTNSGGCTSVASDPTIFSSDFCNQPPVITTTTLTTAVESTVTLNLLTLISDPDNNIDLTTLKITSQPVSGATATIDASGQLLLDYAGKSFSGNDQLTIQVCDIKGKCTQQIIRINVSGELVVYTGISPNGDNLNDTWIIKYIDVLPDTKVNKVSIFNRWGDQIFETENYNNQDRAFKGIGKNGSEVPTGVYFYTIEFASGLATKTGYLSLRK